MDHIQTTDTAVVVGLDFFYQSWNHRKSTLPRNLDNWDMGIVLYPNAEDIQVSHENRAGHSVVLVGWDLDLEFPTRDAEGNIVVDGNGDPVMEKGFFIFKNSWGTTGFGIENPFGAGYGYLSMRYIAEFGNARVTDLPILDLPPPGGEDDGDEGGEDDGGLEGETFSSTEAVEIPDNNPGGARSVIDVTSTGLIERVTVDLDVSHTWRGDLLVRLVHGDEVVVLHERSGGGQDDLQLSLDVDAFVGLERSGEWILEVVDTANSDVGRLNGWSVTLR
jgi:hypothetical protein